MNRQQAEKAFSESLKKHIHDHTHRPTQGALRDEAFASFGVNQDPGGLGIHATQTDFVVVLASVRGAVLDLLEEAGVLK